MNEIIHPFISDIIPRPLNLKVRKEVTHSTNDINYKIQLLAQRHNGEIKAKAARKKQSELDKSKGRWIGKTATVY